MAQNLLERTIATWAPQWARIRSQARLEVEGERIMVRAMGAAVGGAFDAGKVGTPRSSWSTKRGRIDEMRRPAPFDGVP